MRDFFTFYENIKSLHNPFVAFSLAHVCFLLLSAIGVVCIYRYYKRLEMYQKDKFQRGMAYYFIIEETIYTIWLLLNCKSQVWIQILPLELCSLCAYCNVCSVFLKKEYFRFFSGVVGLVAGLLALLYPANVSGLYPIISYRMINFYMIHASFVLFSLIQLQDRTLFSYRHIKKNTVIICSMFTIAYFTNLFLNSQYMLVGIPPNISFIAYLFRFTGIVFFLPIVLIIVTLLQFVVLYILRLCYGVKKKQLKIHYRY